LLDIGRTVSFSSCPIIEVQFMSRRPFSQHWKGPLAFLLGAILAYSVLMWTSSYVLAISTLLMALIGYGVYAIGESSDLPGTTGKHDKDVPT
jgi:hypothetical protein